jgi:ABC-2 type transport system permease protein
MRKVWVIAAREYNAAVHTKAFLISLLIMPILMCGSLLVEVLTRNAAPTEMKRYAVIDLSPGGVVYPLIQKQLEYLPQQQRENVSIEQETPASDTPEAAEQLREHVAERVRHGAFVGFVVIPADVFKVPEPGTAQPGPSRPGTVYYRTNRPLDRFFAPLVQQVVQAQALEQRARTLGVSSEKARQLTSPVEVKTVSPDWREAASAADQQANQEKDEVARMAAVLVPILLMVLMYMVIMMTTMPLMQAVLEEKMQRIAEVLLGSVRPFPLMLGKLLGMTGVSLTISAVYLGGAGWGAAHFGFDKYVRTEVIVWFLVFQALAVLMCGSLFTAVGAAASDLKETQSMVLPIMILVMLPFFVMPKLLQEPNGNLITEMSFFPFATPMLMVGRLGVPNGIPQWQLYVGVAVVLATTLLCVWAAGRIFRVGILMQGKGARLGDLARWVLRG